MKTMKIMAVGLFLWTTSVWAVDNTSRLDGYSDYQKLIEEMTSLRQEMKQKVEVFDAKHPDFRVPEPEDIFSPENLFVVLRKEINNTHYQVITPRSSVIDSQTALQNILNTGNETIPMDPSLYTQAQEAYRNMLERLRDDQRERIDGFMLAYPDFDFENMEVNDALSRSAFDKVMKTIVATRKTARENFFEAYPGFDPDSKPVKKIAENLLEKRAWKIRTERIEDRSVEDFPELDTHPAPDTEDEKQVVRAYGYVNEEYKNMLKELRIDKFEKVNKFREMFPDFNFDDPASNDEVAMETYYALMDAIWKHRQETRDAFSAQYPEFKPQLKFSETGGFLDRRWNKDE